MRLVHCCSQVEHPTGGAGFERNGVAHDDFTVKGKKKPHAIGPWIQNNTLFSRVMGDKRHLDIGTEDLGPTAKRHGDSVPGYLGVYTEGSKFLSERDRRPAWSLEYDGGYDVCIWDRANAVKQWVAHRRTADEAAKVYDSVALAYDGAQADTNYAYPAGDVSLQKDSPGKLLVLEACRLLELEDMMDKDCMKADTEKIAQFREKVFTECATKAPNANSVKILATQLAWFTMSLKDEVIFPHWRGAKLQELVESLRTVDTLGGRDTKMNAILPHGNDFSVCFKGLTSHLGLGYGPLFN
eukprot:gene29185-36301_t